jgi:DNA mismatch endonuclease, patch repair protein
VTHFAWTGVSAATRASMRANKSTHTKPEKQVRSLLWNAGYRFRMHARQLPGKPDIVFTTRKRLVFVHGCFWHQHQGCKRSHRPSSRLGYWKAKLRGNRRRDRKTIKSLETAGWKVLVIWECEVKDTEKLMSRLRKFLGKPGTKIAVRRARGAPPEYRNRS